MSSYKVELITAGNRTTGSIARILALGADDVECIVEPIEFGLFPSGSSISKYSTITSATVPAGTYIEGPIYQFMSKATTGGSWLVYKNI